MSDLGEKVFEYLESDSLIHLSNIHKRRKLYDEIISMVLSEALIAINANVSIETGDRYNAIEDAICIIEGLK
jgi:hypothetical protein